MAFKLEWSEEALEDIESIATYIEKDSPTYAKIENFVYPQLRENPHFGINIKKLKGQLEGYYRYRVGNYRLFYLIEDEKLIIAVIDFKHRQQAYD